MEKLNIGIIGGKNSGKSTFINGIFSREICLSGNKIHTDINGFENKINLDFDYYEINIGEKNVNLENYNLDIYVFIFRKINDFENETIKTINETIEKNKNGKLILLQNIWDDEDSSESDEYDIVENNNVVRTNIYSMFLYRILYLNDGNISEEVNSALNKKIKLLVGEIEYKKNKNMLSTFEGKKKHLRSKSLEIYESMMKETNFFEIKHKILDILYDNYETFYNKHMFNALLALKKSNNALNIVEELFRIAGEIKKNPNSSCVENMTLVNNIMENELKNAFQQKFDNPTEISNDLIKKTELLSNFFENKFSEQIEKLKILRRDNLIYIFEKKFDSELMVEIYDKITMEILKKSLSNTITSDLPFESYLNIIENIADISNTNLNYIALCASFLATNYIKNNQKIFKYKLGKFMMNHKNSTEYILYHIYDNINYEKNASKYHTIEEFNSHDEFLNKFYETIVSIFDEQQISTVNDVTNYIAKYNNAYNIPIITNLYVKSLFEETKDIKKTLKIVKKMHLADELSESLEIMRGTFNLKISENSKFKKIKKAMKNQFIFTGDKNNSESIKKVLGFLKSNISKDVKQKDLIEYLQIYDDYFEISDDLIYGLKKIDEFDDETTESIDLDDSDEKNASESESEKNSKPIKKSKSTKNTLKK